MEPPNLVFFSWFFLRSQYSSSTRRPYDPVANSTSWHVGRALWSSAHLVPLLGTFRTVPSCGQQKQDLIVPHYSTTVPIYQVHSCCRVNTNNGDIFRLHWPLDPVAHMLMMPASSWPSSSKSSWTWGPTALRWRKESQKHPKCHVQIISHVMNILYMIIWCTLGLCYLWKYCIVVYVVYFPESVWAKGSSKSGGLLYSFTCSPSHPYIFTYSHLHIFTNSHLHIFTSSYLHILTSSHLHIFSSSHLHIFFLSWHLHIFTSSHLHIFFLSSHFHIFTSSHLHIFTSSLLHIFTSSHLHIFTSSHLHLHTFTSSHLHIFFLSSHLLLILTSSHLLIFTSSFLHIFTSSHLLLIFTSSHLHIFTSSSYLHIFTSSHLHIFTSSHLHFHIFTSLSSHFLIFTSSSYLHIFTSSNLLLIFTSSHLHTSSHLSLSLSVSVSVSLALCHGLSPSCSFLLQGRRQCRPGATIWPPFRRKWGSSVKNWWLFATLVGPAATVSHEKRSKCQKLTKN